MQVCAGFGVNDEALTASFDITLSHHVRCEHHEVCFKRLLRIRTHSGDDVGSEREVRHELAIHYVELNDVNARLVEGMNFLAKLREIGGQNGWRNMNGQCHAIHPSQ